MNNKYYDRIFYKGKDLWLKLEGKTIFVAGHTGFYGSWFLGFLKYLRNVKEIDIVVQGGSKSTGWLINNASTYTDFQSHADYVINCVGSSSPDLHGEEILYQHVGGVISLASSMRVNTVLLQISSGVVSNKFNDSAYAEAKRTAEWFLNDMKANVRIVRPFATVGPGMGLNKHFAISQFIKNELDKKPLEVSIPPVARAFVHITDLMVQIFHVMLQDSKTPFEVGSDDEITLLDAANVISKNVISVEKEFSGTAGATYSANLERVRKDFDFVLDYNSKAAILDTYQYYERL